MNYIYTGWFLDPNQLRQALCGLPSHRLSKEIATPHVTLAFRPKEVFSSCFGTRATITAIGYGNDGENEGLLVTVQPEAEPLRQVLSSVSVPHITLSTSDTGKPVNTAKLDFIPISPIVLNGIYGGCRYNGILTLTPKK